jgi:hypothetical protein
MAGQVRNRNWEKNKRKQTFPEHFFWKAVVLNNFSRAMSTYYLENKSGETPARSSMSIVPLYLLLSLNLTSITGPLMFALSKGLNRVGT